MKTINVLAEDFKASLINLINHSGLPLTTVYYIYKDVASDLEKTYYNTVDREASQTETEVEQEQLDTENNSDEIQ